MKKEKNMRIKENKGLIQKTRNGELGMKSKTSSHYLPLFLLCSLLIFSCSMETSPEKLPEGFGSFSLRVDSSRTIFPTIPEVPNGFESYTLEFTATSGGENKTENRTGSTLSSPVTLRVGTYSLIVSAYMDTGRTRLAARGTLTGIVIGSGESVSRTITLKTISDTGSGTFNYTVTISASGVTSATMAITKNGTAIDPVILYNAGATTDNPTLDVGVYNVRFTLIKDGDVKEEAVWNEILYIRAELPSNFSITFDEDYFYRTHYNVTFKYNDGVTPDYLQSVMHDDTFSLSIPSRTGHTFEGWHTDEELTDFYTPTRVYNDFTLYAKWEEITNSPEDPFLVNDETELRYVGKGGDNPDGYKEWTLSAHYKQTANITLEEGNWTAIGTYITLDTSVQFTGSYNGGGYTITGLTLTATTQYQGMFGYIGTGGKVENLGLINVDISSTANYAGGIAGSNTGTIQNCSVSGSVTGTQNAGGIAGQNSTGGTIQNCSVSGSVIGTQAVGGIVGFGAGTIQNCSVSGSITGTQDVGGIMGSNSNGTILNCSASGSVTGTNVASNSFGVGGIAGSNQGTIRNCVALNEKVTHTGTGTSSGRIQGTGSSGTRTNNYAWSGMTLIRSGNHVALSSSDIASATIHGLNLTAADAKIAASWTTAGRWSTAGGASAWNFTTVWQWDDSGVNMPSLRDVGTAQPWPTYLVDNTPENPYLVNNQTELRYVGKGNSNPDEYKHWTLTAHYRQTTNITLEEGAWTRIGTGSGANSFTGSYNGDGHIIFGLSISSNADYQGMFGCIGAGGKVENLSLINVNINVTGGTGTNGYTGGIAGYIEGSGTIQNCSVSGSITGTQRVGGIAGFNNNSAIIQKCFFNGSVTGTSSNVGGIAGQFNSGIIRNCYVIFTGGITGTTSVGGIAGQSEGLIQNCYVSGSITGTGTSGGIVGNSITNTIQNCVALNNSVTLTGTDTNSGRISGSTPAQQNNYAWKSMTLIRNGSPVMLPSSDTGLATRHGANITAVDARAEAWWTAAGRWSTADGAGAWDFDTVWQWNNDNRMPSLRGVEAQQWPTYFVDSFDLYAAVAAYATATESLIINVPEDLILPENVNVPAPADASYTLTIRSASGGIKTITRGFVDTTADNGLFIVPNTAKLIFEDIVIDGNYKDSGGTVNTAFANNAASLVRVNSSGGTLTLNNGAVLKNNRANNGGGVNSYGTFNMNGGEISGNEAASNRGGGVCSYNTFNMNGGEIRGNRAGYGGGVDQTGGPFNMSGGEIRENTATQFGGGVSNSGTFTMSGGKINGNNVYLGCGVFLNGGTFNMNSGEISGNNGNAVYMVNITRSSTFNMSGSAVISGNSRGGVYIPNDNTFNMSGGSITGNFQTASENGAGVMNDGTFRVGGTAQIYGNKKPNSSGTDSNVYLGASKYITLHDSATGDPASSMNIYVTTASTDGVFVDSGALAGDEAYFTADEAGKTVIRSGGQLIIAGPYTVTYDINGGSGTTPATQTVTAGTSVTLNNGSGLTKTGFIFAGWNTEADGAGTDYASGSTHTPTGNLTLYAKWVEVPTDWTAITGADTTFGSTQINGIAWGNDKFVAVGGGLFGGGGKMAYSADGVTWIGISATDSTFDTSSINGIVWGGGKFVAVGDGGKIAHSTDGINWIAVSDSKFPSTDSIYDIAWGNGTFVAVGNIGKMSYSTDGGVNWTFLNGTNSTFGTMNIYGITWNNGKFFAVGDDGKMAYSENGITWTGISATNSTFGGTIINSITYGGDKYVAVGGYNPPAMAYSPDGITWTAVADTTFGNSGEIKSIAWGNGTFVAVGEYAKMAYSVNGITWTAISSTDNTFGTLNINGIAYGNGRFVAVGGMIGQMAYSKISGEE